VRGRGQHGGIVIDDIVPGHTGKGADFRLAEMKVTNYPGIYHMVEIDPADWHLLPEVPEGRDSTNIDLETEDQLGKYGYIIGQLQRVIFHQPGVKDTNWSTTAPVIGPGWGRAAMGLPALLQAGAAVDQLARSHFAGVRMVIGDALHSLTDLGSGALRWMPTASSGSRRARSACPPGRRAIPSQTQPTS
jgi:hypothetical protein